MNRLATKLCALSAGLFVIASARAADEPQSYLMVCKAGKNEMEVTSRMQTLHDNVRVTSTFVSYRFMKSNRRASDGLAAGYCTWPDRGMNSEEPTTLNMTFTQGIVTWTISTVNTKVGPSYSARAASSEDLGLFLRAFERGDEFQVHAYNNGRGSFVVTNYGP